jgi:TonB family protein
MTRNAFARYASAVTLTAVLAIAATAAAPAHAQGAAPAPSCSAGTVTALPQLVNEREVARIVSHAYPANLLETGITGRATLAVTVGADGRVQSVATLGATQAPFADVAQSVARRMRFLPAKAGGAPVACTVAVPVDFALADG